jgi:hypothetical protein
MGGFLMTVHSHLVNRCAHKESAPFRGFPLALIVSRVLSWRH